MARIKDNEAPACEVLGIGAVLTNDDGRVVAHCFDFDKSGYGGFKLWEAQRIRVRDRIVRQYVNTFCYGDMASAIEDHQARQIVDNLRNKGKLRLTFVAIGHDLTDADLN